MIGSSVLAAQTIPNPAFPSATLPRSRLAIREGDSSRTFWTSDAAPTRWTRTSLADGTHWQRIDVGVETATVQLAGTGEAWRTRLVLVRLDPALLQFSLDTASSRTRRPAWNLKRVPSDAVFAMNVGQFRANMPWGLVILNGRQTLAPERGPLALTIAFDSTSASPPVPSMNTNASPRSVRWIFDGDSVGAHAHWAFQSYPVLLQNANVPILLQAADRGIDVAHRDARLALARLPDGRLLVALTRFDGLGASLGSIPFGLTVPEMAAVMGALGAQDAVLLDGGISAQLSTGRGPKRVQLKGWRDVPMGLIAKPRVSR